MPLDTSIALQTRGVQAPDLVAGQGQLLTLKHLLDQGRMSEMQFQQSQQAQLQEQKLSQLYQSNVGADGDVNRQGLIQGAAQGGLGARIPGLQKSFAEADEAKAKVNLQTAQAKNANYEGLRKQAELVSGSLGSLLAKPNVTHDDVIGMVSGLVQQGVIPAEQGANMVRTLPGDPSQLRPFLMQKGMETLDAAKRLEAFTPKIDYKNTGKKMVPVDTNALTNPNPTALTMTTTPDADQSASVQIRGQNVSAATAKRGQDITAENGKWQYDSTRGGLVNTKTGQFKEAVQDGVPIGQVKEKADAKQRMTDANDAIPLIKDANKLLDTATGSYAGIARDVLAGSVGVTTEGSKSAAQLKALEGMLVSKMPKMSGPQSDKDVANYKQMAANVGDATLPAETRRAALQTVLNIQERYAGLPASKLAGKGSSSTAAPATGTRNITVDY